MQRTEIRSLLAFYPILRIHKPDNNAWYYNVMFRIDLPDKIIVSAKSEAVFYAVSLENDLLAMHTHHQFIANGLARQRGYQLGTRQARRFNRVLSFVCATLVIYFTVNQCTEVM